MLGAQGSGVAHPESACDSSKKTCYKEGEQLVSDDIDPQSLGGNVVVSNSYPGPSRLGTEQVGHGDNDQGGEDCHEIVDLKVTVHYPGPNLDRARRQRKGLSSPSDLAYVLGQDKIHGDELGRHGGE